MSKKSRPDWRLAPVKDFVAIVISWTAKGLMTSSDNRSGPVSFSGSAWMGWIAQAPTDWTGVVDRLHHLAPRGSYTHVDLSLDGKPCFNAWSPVKPSGAHAPWLPSEEVGYQDVTSPRIAVLRLTFNTPGAIPSVWSDSWDEAMTRLNLVETMAPIAAELACMGFSFIEPLGLHQDLCGKDYWVSVASSKGDAWDARVQASQLDNHIPLGLAKGHTKSL